MSYELQDRLETCYWKQCVHKWGHKRMEELEILEEDLRSIFQLGDSSGTFTSRNFEINSTVRISLSNSSSLQFLID